MTWILYTLLVLLAWYGCQMIRFRGAWKDIPLFRRQPVEGNDIFLTVIVPARNEAAHIEKCLQSLLRQDYPADAYEIIVVDDHSEDDTARMVRSFTEKHAHVHCLHLADHLVPGHGHSFKKMGITAAIAKSRGNYIVTTDADCTAGPGWLSGIAEGFLQKDATALVMPVRMGKPDGMEAFPGILAAFQSLDFLTLQGITGAALHRGWFGMSNGANFAYRKKSFEAVHGFTGIDDLASGDDMLLLHKLQQYAPGTIHYLLSPELIIDTHTEPDWRSLLSQRIRWASKSTRYPDKRLFPVMLGTYLLNLLMFLSFFVQPWYVSLILLGIKTGVEWVFIKPVAVFFRQAHLLPYFPILQPLHILYMILAGGLGRLKKYQWKGRLVP